MVEMMSEPTIAPTETKPPLKSGTIWGLWILSGMEVAEILTGDPFSTNGAIKTVLWLAGTGLVLWGRVKRRILPLRWW
ncbi:MAG: hypothetical protein AAFN38_21740 [Cyanobacteria bacterium J06560_5]